jgi:hypothetical protein
MTSLTASLLQRNRSGRSKADLTHKVNSSNSAGVSLSLVYHLCVLRHFNFSATLQGEELPAGPGEPAAGSGRRCQACSRVKVRRQRKLPPLLFLGSHDDAEEQGRPAQSSSSRQRSASLVSVGSRARPSEVG